MSLDETLPSGALSIAQLHALVVDAVESVLSDRPPRPELLTLDELAAALQVTTRKLYDLRQDPTFPELRIGDAPRFRLDAVLAWLEAHSSP